MISLLHPRAFVALVVGFGLGASPAAVAQIGGRQAFSFLNLPPGAKTAALGSVNVSVRDADPTMMLSNPALLNADMDGRLALTFVDYLSDIKQSTASYAFKPKQADAQRRLGFSLTYLSYGQFDQYDAAGNLLGQFSVNEYAAGPTYAYVQGPFTLGGSLRLAVSGISGNHSVATVADVGAVFKHPEKEFTVGLAVKNAGYQFKPYAGAGREPMPLDVQLGATIKPEHMPLRFSITAHNLQRLDIVYLDPNQRGQLNENGEEIKKKKSLGDKIARHFAVGGELLLGKSLNVRLGYNHLQRRELRLENAAGGAGISFGVMVRVSQFQLDYTRAGLHASGAANYFTVARNLNSLFVRKQ